MQLSMATQRPRAVFTYLGTGTVTGVHIPFDKNNNKKNLLISFLMQFAIRMIIKDLVGFWLTCHLSQSSFESALFDHFLLG